MLDVKLFLGLTKDMSNFKLPVTWYRFRNCVTCLEKLWTVIWGREFGRRRSKGSRDCTLGQQGTRKIRKHRHSKIFTERDTDMTERGMKLIISIR